jgi:uncharacterized protein YoxC
MGGLLGSLSFIIAVLFYLFFCGTMAAIVLMLRKISKEMVEVKKALAGLEEQVTLLGPRTRTAARE